MASISHDSSVTEDTSGPASQRLHDPDGANVKNQPPRSGNDGVGGQSALLADDDFALKKDLALVRRAVKSRWNVPADRRSKIVQRVCDIADSERDDALEAARVLVSMDTADTNAFQVLDKIHRLDTGQSTENVAAVQYIEGVSKGDV